MKRISLDNVLPSVFADEKEIGSGIWKRQIQFEKANSYLIEAVSGKGKSSLCSYVYGYREDYFGTISFNNSDIKKIPGRVWDRIRSRELSLLFQELNLFPELTAIENVVLKNNLTSYKSRRQITEMFERLGIADRINRRVEKMSWGQQQRVAIIRALCQPFDFLILDEPVSHLDDENARIVAELVMEEVRQQDAGIIVTSIGKQLPLDYSYKIAL